MTRVKICGIRSRDDALLCADLGAWALGFVFHRPSPRFIEPVKAAPIVAGLPEGVLAVGVFVDWPLDELQAAVAVSGVAAVQLHGSELPEYAAGIRAGEVWKALRVGEGFAVEAMDPYRACARILLDAYSERSPGGTGETFAWEIARRAQARRPVLLAGGIRPENAARALEVVGPEGIDVSSGVEARPGVKDPVKLEQLFEAVRAHDERAPGKSRGAMPW